MEERRAEEELFEKQGIRVLCVKRDGQANSDNMWYVISNKEFTEKFMGPVCQIKSDGSISQRQSSHKEPHNIVYYGMMADALPKELLGGGYNRMSYGVYDERPEGFNTIERMEKRFGETFRKTGKNSVYCTQAVKDIYGDKLPDYITVSDWNKGAEMSYPKWLHQTNQDRKEFISQAYEKDGEKDFFTWQCKKALEREKAILSDKRTFRRLPNVPESSDDNQQQFE